MSIVETINDDIKKAMLARDKTKLTALRAVKSAFLLEQTKSSDNKISDDKAIQIMQKLVKQRNESAEIYIQQNRPELSNAEKAEADIIMQYLPKPFSEEELIKNIEKIISETNASSIADMGKVMGIATKSLAGKADGKQISVIVKKLLS
ncbi:MAG TPA: GatB/YqeY domain-containing protein [Bacteroidales bacterium]|nr:GatB/YqeY domain-containing protein [Bacteroidales bacterium]